MVSKWFQCIVYLLNKDKKGIPFPKETFTDAIDVAKVYLADGIFSDCLAIDLIQMISGLSSLSSGDIKGMRPLALKIGGFPEDVDKLE